MPAYRRERLETPDGDFLDLDWVSGFNTPPTAAPAATPSKVPLKAAHDADVIGATYAPPIEKPLVVLFHGLEGSAASHYARALMHAVADQGWHGVVVHFRGCSGVPNRLPRGYHSGDSAEIAWVLDQLSQRYDTLNAVGVSLGGNALLKYLGEQGTQAKPHAAVAISVPYDLTAANVMLSHGIGKLYSRHFLRSLIPGALAKAARFPGHPGLTEIEQIRAARTLRDFDNAVTAPLHGFTNADDYYTQSSCKQYLNGITVPTLLVHAANDPFLPASAAPQAPQLVDNVQLELSACGGHVGFVSGNLPGNLNWLPQRVLGHLGQHAGNNRLA